MAIEDRTRNPPLSNDPNWVRGDSRLITPSKRSLTADEVRAILDYDQHTGILRWKVRRYKTRIQPGDIAGCITKTRGEVVIGIGSPPGNQYKAHHLAWLIMTGEWPEHTIDHRDLNPSNNRWENLRPATKNQQQQNRPKHRDNTSGYKGVAFLKGKWMAQIMVNRAQIYLGVFETPQEASEAYKEAALKYHGEFANTD